MYKISNPADAITQILGKLNVSQTTGLQNHIGKAGNGAVRYGKQVVHKITGHTQRNIQIQTVNNLHVSVLSKAIYSGFENARGGDHAFFDQMYEYTKTTYGGTVAIGEIRSVFRQSVLSVPGVQL